MEGQPRSRSSILVVDDDPAACDQIRVLLEAAGYDVWTAASGEEALDLADEPPQLGILEVCLPGISGYELCRELKRRFGEALPVVLVSATRTEPHDRVAGLLIGGDDYLAKPFAPGELLIRVSRLLRGSMPLSPAITRRLTKREREVLALLAQGFDHREIAARLVLSPKTVETHLEHVLDKLGVHSRAQAVAAAYRGDLVNAR